MTLSPKEILTYATTLASGSLSLDDIHRRFPDDHDVVKQIVKLARSKGRTAIAFNRKPTPDTAPVKINEVVEFTESVPKKRGRKPKVKK